MQKFLCAIVLYMTVLSIFGQSRYHLKNFSTSDGLSFKSVSSINQDSIGFIWIATKNGLNRFDGLNFKIYSKQNSNLKGNGISKIFFDSENRMWIGSYSGIYLYHQKQDTIALIQSNEQDFNSTNVKVNDIFEDESKNLWIAAEDGIYSIDLSVDEKKLVTIKKNQPFEYVEKFSDDTLLIGSVNQGLFLLDLKSKNIFQPDYLNPSKNSKAPNHIRCVYKVEDGYLIGSWKQGISFLKLGSGDISPFIPVLEDEVPVSLAIEKFRDQYWVATNIGLIVLSKDLELVHHFKKQTRPNGSLPGNSIQSLFPDRDGNLWIGTEWDGLSVLYDQWPEVKYIATFKGDANLSILDIYVKNDSLLLGTDGNGLAVHNFNSGLDTLITATSASPVNGNYIHLITSDHTPKVYFGTYLNGFSIFDLDTKKITRYNNSKGLSHNDVRDILVDKEDLWVAMWGQGIDRFTSSTETFTNFSFNENTSWSLSDNDVTDLEWENDSVFWIATYSGGVNRFNTNLKKFKRFAHDPYDENSISEDNVLCLRKSRDNKLWIGYWAGGLDYIDLSDQRIHRFSKGTELESAIVTAIEEDEAGNIWVSTKKGIAKINPLSRELSIISGPEYQVNEFHIGSSTRDQRGLIYFGGIGGYVKIDPTTSFQNQENSRLLLSDLKIFNEDIKPGSGILRNQIFFENEIILEHDQSVFSFELSTLKFPSSSNCIYEVMLENFEQEWRSLKNSPVATFTNLPPGEYNFLFRSKCENDQNWSQTNSIVLVIKHPWWANGWAYSAYTLIFLGLLYLFYSYTSSIAHMRSSLKAEKILRNKEQEIYDFKQRFFTNLSHELRTPISLILNSIDHLKDKMILTKEFKKSYFGIKRNSNHLLQLLSEILDFNKIESNKLTLQVSQYDFVVFAQEIYLSFLDEAQRKLLKFEFKTDADQIQLYFDWNHMEKVLYNLLSNAIKFTQEHGSVKVHISLDDQFVYFQIKDNGLGISEEDQITIFEPFKQGNSSNSTPQGFGLGLYISKDIINQHGGAISVESKPAKGSSFLIKLPLGFKHFSKNDILLEESSNTDSYQIENILLEKETNFEFDITNSTILIVDDSDDLRKYLVSLFNSSFIVYEASNGIEAFEISINQQPDMVITDVVMPGLDGIQLTKKLKSDKRTSHIPIIVLTGRTSLFSRHEGYETGADDYVTKPFNDLLLKVRVRNLLRNRKLMAEKVQRDELTNAKETALSSPDEEFLNDLTRIIDENLLNADLNAAFISQNLGMSHSVIYKKAKALTSMSLVEFIRDYRLKKAAYYIKEGGFTVSDASNKVGFSDTNYFSKAFKKRYGINPSKYIG